METKQTTDKVFWWDETISGFRHEGSDWELKSDILNLLEPYYENKKRYDFLEVLRNRVEHLKNVDANEIFDFDKDLVRDFTDRLQKLDEVVKALEQKGWHYIVGVCQRDAARWWGDFDYHPIPKNQLCFAQWNG